MSRAFTSQTVPAQNCSPYICRDLALGSWPRAMLKPRTSLAVEMLDEHHPHSPCKHAKYTSMWRRPCPFAGRCLAIGDEQFRARRAMSRHAQRPEKQVGLGPASPASPASSLPLCTDTEIPSQPPTHNPPRTSAHAAPSKSRPSAPNQGVVPGVLLSTCYPVHLCVQSFCSL